MGTAFVNEVNKDPCRSRHTGGLIQKQRHTIPIWEMYKQNQSVLLIDQLIYFDGYCHGIIVFVIENVTVGRVTTVFMTRLSHSILKYVIFACRIVTFSPSDTRLSEIPRDGTVVDFEDGRGITIIKIRFPDHHSKLYNYASQGYFLEKHFLSTFFDKIAYSTNTVLNCRRMVLPDSPRYH